VQCFLCLENGTMQHRCKVCDARWHNLCLQNRLEGWETDNICGRAYCCSKTGIAAPKSDRPAFFGCLQGKSQLRQSGSNVNQDESTTPSKTPEPPELMLSPSPVPMARNSSHSDFEDSAKNKDNPSSGEKKPLSAHPRMSGACPACSPSPIAPLRSS